MSKARSVDPAARRPGRTATTWSISACASIPSTRRPWAGICAAMALRRSPRARVSAPTARARRSIWRTPRAIASSSRVRRPLEALCSTARYPRYVAVEVLLVELECAAELGRAVEGHQHAQDFDAVMEGLERRLALAEAFDEVAVFVGVAIGRGLV